MARAIVAIGGGEITPRGTAAIDREIIRLSNKQHPRVLFVPTASSDSATYWERFQDQYEKFLKCRTDVLLLVSQRPSKREIERKILSADIVYVGGGNTLFMMRLWRRLGVDRMLKAAYQDGIVLAGISAGAICWFDSGHSDSMSFYHPQRWSYINVTGLGLIHGVHCPHYNGTTLGVARRKDFQKMIRRIGGTGIALDNNCAMEFIDGRFYRVIASNDRARAYRVYKTGREVVAEQIPKRPQLAALGLLNRVGARAASRVSG